MIEVKNIGKIYKSGDIETVALKNISFEVPSGEFVAITGPSGCGKSTLMHILGCLDTPTKGKYFLEGVDVSNLSDDQLAEIRKSQIGFVFQSFNLLPRMTVLRNVMLPLIYTGISKEERERRAKECLKSVGFEESHFFHLSNQLSGGQMQRVAIARALINNPKLILADEPTGNLDSKTGEIVLGTFQKLHRKQKCTIVLITHDHSVAEHSQRIIYMRDGEIIDDVINQNQKISEYA
ncbi:MAG: ABC transporter ATP-binding protein [Candidatus Pacebacteria bacterium]|nr:ABC transporter ATP-binding protein [Candidatus Paceibacterota bacterium]